MLAAAGSLLSRRGGARAFAAGLRGFAAEAAPAAAASGEVGYVAQVIGE